jgi:hypothetical protein
MREPQTQEECVMMLEIAYIGLLGSKNALENNKTDEAQEIISRTVGVLA